MNINAIKAVVVPAVKTAAASGAGQAVGKVVKNVAKAGLKGLNFGGCIGAFVVATKVGYRIANSADKSILKPIDEMLSKMEKGEPDFTVTFHKEANKSTVVEEPTEAENSEQPKSE